MNIKQREGDDCTICAIAMATGLSYERVMRAAATAVGGYRYHGVPGTQSPKSVLLDLGFEAPRRLPLAGMPGSVWRKLLCGRRAILSVPSLNGFQGHHDVYWDGRAIHDPSTKETYGPDALNWVTPIWAVILDERATVSVSS